MPENAFQDLVSAVGNYVKKFKEPSPEEYGDMDEEQREILLHIYGLADALNDAGYDCGYEKGKPEGYEEDDESEDEE